MYPMFEIPVGVIMCWNARDTFKNKGPLLLRCKFLIKNEYLIAGYRGSQHFLHRVYARVQPCGISAIWKKMLHKIYIATSNGLQKNMDPRISTFFLNKVFENITDNSTDLMATL